MVSSERRGTLCDGTLHLQLMLSEVPDRSWVEAFCQWDPSKSPFAGVAAGSYRGSKVTRSIGRSDRRTWRRLGGISVAVLIEQMRLARVFLPRERSWSLAKPTSTLDTPNQASTRYLESRERVATSGERTGQSSSGLDEGRPWYHLKYCNWVLGSTSTMPRRPTDGCRSAGAAVLRLMVRRGVTSRTNDNWNARCNGLMRNR
jgi:hypothetical protein